MGVGVARAGASGHAAGGGGSGLALAGALPALAALVEPNPQVRPHPAQRRLGVVLISVVCSWAASDAPVCILQWLRDLSELLKFAACWPVDS